jgi:hypothetical protein
MLKFHARKRFEVSDSKKLVNHEEDTRLFSKKKTEGVNRRVIIYTWWGSTESGRIFSRGKRANAAIPQIRPVKWNVYLYPYLSARCPPRIAAAAAENCTKESVDSHLKYR